MRISDLQTFIDVVEAGGMTQAASTKGVSQPGLSRIIRELESQMGATLFRRTGRGVELTNAGSEFLSFSRETIARFDETKQRIRDVSGAMPERLSIAIPTRLGSFVFPELYRRFMQAMPDVTVHAAETMSEDMADGMQSGRFDLLASYLPAAPGAGLAEPVFIEDLYLVGAPRELDATDDTIRLTDLAGQQILLNSRRNRYRRHIEQAYASIGQKLVVSREIETAEGLLAFTKEGEGITILPFSNFYGEASRGEVTGRRIVEPPIRRAIYIHASRRLDRRTATQSISLLKQSLSAVAEKVRWRGTSDA